MQLINALLYANLVSGMVRRYADNCINKADPKCHIADYICTYDGGATVSITDVKNAATGFCDANQGYELAPFAWLNSTHNIHGHEILLGTHNLGGNTITVSINQCRWALDGIVSICGDGQGTRGGYIWIPPSQYSYGVGIDGNLPDHPCGGACRAGDMMGRKGWKGTISPIHEQLATA